MSVGAAPVGGVAAANSWPQASFAARVAQPASTSASVAKFAIVGVWLLLSGPWIAVPSRNCAWVHTDATVVISLTTALPGGLLPSTAMSARAGFSPLTLLASGRPPFATRYRMA